ncbi:sugar ABC transporter permease [Bombiscardovia nodaiensis]|uniref:Maltose/maltodextrin transport system permease protein n=1 Tax=Bombiscardovia nodaiensis TaxID=2932181 RepID=A0ABN6SBL8_9BIFI|nr:sugar ABC transporter permease [Bombiscardovia nodaiensis]
MSSHDSQVDQGKSRKRRQAERIAERASVRLGPTLVKIVLLGLLDAFSVYSAFMLAARRSWYFMAAVIVVALVINWIYWQQGHLAAKYLTPGLIFLLIFQLFAITYSAYISFTNYGTGHNGDKEQAITSLLQAASTKVPNSPSYTVTVVQCGKDLGFAIANDDGEIQVGNAHTPLHQVQAASSDESGHVSKLPGCQVLDFNDLLSRQDEVTTLAVPLSSDAKQGQLKTSDGQTAFVYKPSLEYNRAKDTMTDTTTGLVYTDRGTGAFVAEGDKELKPGWKINVGLSNFTSVFASKQLRGPFGQVMVWTIEFSVISVASTFILGLFLALVFNEPRMKGRKIYRSILILPYAFPAFLSALVWSGLLNEKFGFVNQVLLGGADIPWLHSAGLAKIAILVVNLWLGFPYMFLVCMGALQSIPEDLSEAAKIDGASAWQIFRLIKFPLLLVSVAPLLISSFAMNFNNFNLIYMLTQGGPAQTGTGLNVGSTDILISMVYKIAFVGADKNYGLASAFAIVIFAVVALVSAIGFRASKSLEELN